MTRVNPLHKLIITLLVVFTAVSLSAEQKKRGVQKPGSPATVSPPPPPTPPPATAAVLGSVIDAVSRGPVVSADVFASSGRYVKTDAQGNFKILMVPGDPTVLKIQRFGYQRLETTVVVPTGNLSQQFSLTPLPTVSVRTVAGVTIPLATETVEFGYLVPFAGLVKDRRLAMCKLDRSEFTPETTEIKRIIGPAVAVTSTPCCPSGSPGSKITVELRTGERVEAVFNDSCYGYAMEVVGLNQVTANLVDLKLTEVAEVVFP